MSQRVARHLLIHGRVQGVFFRGTTQQKAAELKLDGWVRNLPDGRVEVTVWGESKAVDALIAWCRQGPPHARVDEVIVEESRPGQTAGFHIRH